MINASLSTSPSFFATTGYHYREDRQPRASFREASHTPESDRSRRAGQASMASIVVQPPTQTPSQTYLYPPVVACASLAGAHIDPESITDVFAQIVLVDASGTPHPQLLQGSVVISACELPDGDLAAAGSSASGTGSALYFLFGDIYITVAGSFTLRVDIQVIDTQGQVILVDQTGTRQVHVFNQDVAFENPSAAELALLDRLSAAGCNVPTVL